VIVHAMKGLTNSTRWNQTGCRAEERNRQIRYGFEN